MKKKIHCVIFDLDGTLIDAYSAVQKSLNYTLRQMGHPRVDDATIIRTVGWGDRHLIKTFLKEEKVEAGFKIYRKHHKKSLLTGSRLLPGARRLLEYLKKGKYKVAVVTNRPTLYTHIVLRHLDIRKFFHFVICGDRVERAKPYPDMINMTLKRFSLTPAEAFYVGDMTIDVTAGKRARVKPLVVPTGSCSRRQLLSAKPYRVLSRVDEVIDVLEGEKLKVNGEWKNVK